MSGFPPVPNQSMRTNLHKFVINQQYQKLTAAIGRNIERATGKLLSQNGGQLSMLKRVSKAAADGGDEAKTTAQIPKFNTRKQFRLTSR